MADRVFPLLKSDKPKPQRNHINKTVRISVDLKSAKNPRCPIFNYEHLLKDALRKASNGNGGPFKDGSDNEDEMRRLVSQYEEKYGKASKKYSSYSELGAGYDESDSFIDNTDLCDEGLPDDLDTKKGGFYVNYGKLEFTKVYDQDNR